MMSFMDKYCGNTMLSRVVINMGKINQCSDDILLDKQGVSKCCIGGYLLQVISDI